MPQTPIVLSRRIGAEWQKHIAGRAIEDRAARAEREAAWRDVQAFIPCG